MLAALTDFLVDFVVDRLGNIREGDTVLDPMCGNVLFVFFFFLLSCLLPAYLL